MTASEHPDPFALDPARPDPLATDVPISIKEINELRASIPYLLGFYPERSLVVIGLGLSNQVVVTVRVDAPMCPADARTVIEQIDLILRRCEPHRVVVAYCDDYELPDLGAEEREQVTLSALHAYETVCELAPVISRAFTDRGYPVAFVWPARPGMPRSVLGPVPQIAVAQALAGRTLLRNRAELRAQLRPVGGSARVAVREHLQTMQQVTISRIDLIAMTTNILERYATALESGDAPAPLEAHDVAVCALALADIGARDIIITLIAQERGWWRVEPWCRTVQLVPTAHLAAAATMVAIIAYLIGDGALAQCALDQALAHDPDYSLAVMIAAGLTHGLHPRDLRAVLASTFDEDAP